MGSLVISLSSSSVPVLFPYPFPCCGTFVARISLLLLVTQENSYVLSFPPCHSLFSSLPFSVTRMSAPEVVHTHSNLEVVDNGGKIWSNPKSSTTTDYRQLPQPVELQPEYSPVYNNDSEATPPEKRSGMSLPSKAVAVVLAAMLVILGVGVGIGIAGGMAIQRSESYVFHYIILISILMLSLR